MTNDEIKKPHWQTADGSVQLFHGDCLDVLPTLEPGSVDSVVCDPPYGLGFMGKDWDHGVPGVHFWEAVLRVAKPGAHLLAAGGQRTHHRLMIALEDAGWEIRDVIMHVFGSGFPKSLDISKSIDKAAGAERERIRGVRSGVVGDTFAQDAWSKEFKDSVLSSEAITDAARQWQGWGTALKPAYEPWILCRKPLEGTVAANVLKHGTGGINVDGCRIVMERKDKKGEGGRSREPKPVSGKQSYSGGYKARLGENDTIGRFPANLIHDGSEEVLAGFPDLPTPGNVNPTHRSGGECIYGGGWAGQPVVDLARYNDSDSGFGSAARFFYCAKASKEDREEGLEGEERHATELKYNGGEGFAGRTQLADGSWVNTDKANRQKPRNFHPTVKPTDLMRYLCRLVTPPGGIILDPFMGSGSTGKAAMRENFRFVGIELNAEYMPIAQARIEAELARFPLFGE